MWALDVMVKAITTIVATEKAIQHDVLMHPVRGCPPVHPCLDNLKRDVMSSRLEDRKRGVNAHIIVKVYLIRSEYHGTPPADEGTELRKLRVREDVGQKNVVDFCWETVVVLKE